MRKSFLSVLAVLVVFQSYHLFAQENSGSQKATLIVTSKQKIEVPSIASQIANGTFKPAKNIVKEVNPKKWGKNTSVPGKGLPKDGDPLWLQQTKASKIAGIPTTLDFEVASSSTTPTDPTGAVGSSHFINSWNSSFRIWNKEGIPLTSAASLGTILSGTLGDPIVIYDQFADRFLITEFYEDGFDVAICDGPDPVNDGWYVYQFATNTFPDYPKFSLWSDGYYITANKDQSSASTSEVVFVLERDKMIAGDMTADMQGFPLTDIVTSGFYSPLGFNVNGSELPPVGDAPIVYMQDDAWTGVSSDHLKIWNINVDWDTPANSTISLLQEIPTIAFDGLFDGGSFSNLPQPSGSDIDCLQATIMYMAQYRRFLTYNTVVFNFVVDLDGSDDYSGIRWYELRQDNDGEDWEIYQEGTYSQPDEHSAFCGNMCMDVNGNIALAYTVVSSTQYPALRYTGRFASSTLGEMVMEEEVIMNGTQVDPSFRYGDYAQMTIDPVDDATFWSIGECFYGGTRKNYVGVFKFEEPELTANFSADPAIGCTGEPVDFLDGSFGGSTENYTWNWIFDGGIPPTSTDQNPLNIVFNTDDPHSVTLLVDDGTNSDDLTDTYNVQNIVADFSGVPNPVIVGGQVTFTDYSGCDPDDYSWTFDGGIPSTATGKGPHDVTYDTLGSFLVTLEVSNSAGTDIIDDYYIDVINCSHCDASGGGDEYISGVQLGDINNTGTPASGYFDYTSLSTNLNLSETYSITVTNGNVYSTDDLGVWIDWNQDCDFDDLGENVVCESANDGQGTYDFSVPGTAILGETVLRVRIKYSGSDCGSPCQTTSYGEVEDYTVVIQSNDSPPVADFSADQLTPFVGQTVSFSDLSTNMPTSWNWSFNPTTVTFVGGTNVSSQNPQVQFNSLGLYNVSLTAINSFGSDDEEKIDYVEVVEQGTCTYCATYYTNTIDEWISNVSFHTIDNPSGSTNYSDFTSMSTNVVNGLAYGMSVDITVANGATYTEYCTVFIDWNQDCDFEDNGESFNLGSVSGSGTLSGDITIPVDALNGTTQMRVSMRWNTDPDGCDETTYGEAEDYSLYVQRHVSLDLRALLEGPFNGTEMDNTLNSYLPLDQPYNDAPWDYTEAESVIDIPNTNIIDWVLIDIRDASDAASAVSSTSKKRKAAFILNDGSIVDLNGVSNIEFDIAIRKNMFIAVYHRNHISILSENALSETGGVYNYNFTTAVGQVYGDASGHKQLSPGIWGMFAGDGNNDGIIDVLDESLLWESEAGNEGYLNSDFNLDGQSDNKDKDSYWIQNINSETQLPE